MKIVINANREGYATNQIDRTMTAGELIAILGDYDPDTPIYIGNDPQSYGWYTYGGIRGGDVCEVEEDEEDEHEG